VSLVITGSSVVGSQTVRMNPYHLVLGLEPSSGRWAEDFGLIAYSACPPVPSHLMVISFLSGVLLIM
jgi:hypothetical protein